MLWGTAAQSSALAGALQSPRCMTQPPEYCKYELGGSTGQCNTAEPELSFSTHFTSSRVWRQHELVWADQGAPPRDQR